MKKVLIGNGGHAREVISQIGVNLLRFVDYRFVDSDSLPLSQLDPNEHIVMVAVADSKDRFNIIQRLPKETKYFTWVHPTALILGNDIEIGEGSFIGANSILTTNIKIGKHAILNRANHIGHDCSIGDYFSAMPGSIVSGNVIIEDGVYLGTNASIKEKLSICSSTTIGLNAAVVKNIEEPGIYVGVPARKIR
jgi:sugar O-acyltransferase (sialic acid O-acetyltransferase NeuD family)